MGTILPFEICQHGAGIHNMVQVLGLSS
jgi:hypothetical protein